MGILALIFLTISLAEIAVLVLVESQLGLGWVLLLILVTGVSGAYLMTRQGAGVWRAFVAQLRAGVFPGGPVAEGALLLVGGAFLVTPGFITDATGLALMIPSLRRALIAMGARRLRRRLRTR